MIRVLLYDPGYAKLSEGGEELLTEWAQQPDLLMWVDFDRHPPELERALLLDRFKLHPLGVQDGQRDRHPPKYESFGDHSLLLFKGLAADSTSLEFQTVQIAVFMGERFLVTRHVSESPSIARVWGEAMQDPALFAGGPGGLVLRLSRTVNDRYLPLLLDLEPRLEAIEDEMRDSPNDGLLNELTGYMTALKKLARTADYHLRMFTDLRARPPREIGAALEHELTDVYEHLERTQSLARLFHDMCSDMIDGYISVASHRLNQIMRVLTIVTAIFVPLGFLAGVYGMNFENIPELHSHSGYFILLGVMAAIAISLLLVFRRLRWL